MPKLLALLAVFLDKGLVIPLPIPFLSAHLPGLKLRLFRFDLDPDDGRVGLTIQIEWRKAHTNGGGG